MTHQMLGAPGHKKETEESSSSSKLNGKYVNSPPMKYMQVLIPGISITCSRSITTLTVLMLGVSTLRLRTERKVE